MSSSTSEKSWEQGWDGHDQAQFLRFARLPLPQKLEWLEQAQTIAEHLAKTRPAAERKPKTGH